MKMSYADYAAAEGVNISTLLALTISPKHYGYELLRQRPDTAAMKVGRAVHTAVLEPMRFLRDYALSAFPDWRTKAAREWRDGQEATGKTVLTEAQYRLAERMHEAARAHPIAARYIATGAPEESIFWTDPRTGLRCKGRIDLLNSSIVDLKTTRHASPRLFARDAARLYYHARLAWYQDGVRIVTGKELPVHIIAIENVEPHDVMVYRVGDEALELGRRLCESLTDTLQMCRASGRWPGVAEEEELSLVLPAWVSAGEDEDTETITIGGVPISL
jgi:hypothetical protein